MAFFQLFGKRHPRTNFFEFIPIFFRRNFDHTHVGVLFRAILSEFTEVKIFQITIFNNFLRFLTFSWKRLTFDP